MRDSRTGARAGKGKGTGIVFVIIRQWLRLMQLLQGGIIDSFELMSQSAVADGGIALSDES
jgi:hypothetical protein